MSEATRTLNAMTTSAPQDSLQIQVYGADWCGDCIRTKRVFGEAGISYEWIDLVETPEAAETAKSISGRTNIPVIAYPDGSHQVEPSDDELRAKLTELGLV